MTYAWHEQGLEVYLLNRDGEGEPGQDDEEEGRAVVAGDVVAVHALHPQLEPGERELGAKVDNLVAS